MKLFSIIAILLTVGMAFAAIPIAQASGLCECSYCADEAVSCADAADCADAAACATDACCDEYCCEEACDAASQPGTCPLGEDCC